MPSFKQYIIDFSRLKEEKKWILQCFFQKVSFKDHAFNRNKSHAFAVGTFPVSSNDQYEEGNIKVYVLLRSSKDRCWLIQVLARLDPHCVERRYNYPRRYFAVAVISQLMIFICQSTWCECSAHIDRYYILHLHHNQEITYFIHSTQLKNGSDVDVVVPRYMAYDKRYIGRMNEDKPLSLYYLCLSKLLTFHCGCIQTQLSYRRYERYIKRKYQEG